MSTETTPAEELSFVLPAGSEQASGGNVYNRELVRALRALAGTPGSAPEGSAPGNTVPRVRTLAPSEFQRAIEQGEPGRYFIDTLNLAEAEVIAQKAPPQQAVLVVHHLPSLEPGISPDDPAIGLERATLPLFDRFLATSAFTAELLFRRGFARERIMTVEPGLPPVELGPTPLGPPFRALVVGNLIRRKGIRELLFALAASVAPTDPFSLDIMGSAELDPAYAETVGRVITRSPLLAERVRWHYTASYAEMGDHYRQASVLISAASMETFGMALAEARAHGVPILALDGGYVSRQFTDGVDGHLFTSVDALAEDFLRLVRDSEAMRVLCASARRTATPGPDTWARAARRLLEQL